MVTIPTIDQISGTTVMNKMRSLITNYIDFGTQVAGELSYMMNVIENLPQDITDVYNKATIDGMFANVYTKSETYSKAEVNDLISTIGSFHTVVVDSLPEYGEQGIIYLLQIAQSGENIYKEYIWVNRWELIGELSNIDLSDYYTKSEAISKFTQGIGNIGNDTKPVKVVNGVAIPVSKDFEIKIDGNNYAYIEYNTATIPTTGEWCYQVGNVFISPGTPYFSNENGKIKVLETGLYIITCFMCNDISMHEGVAISGIVRQNSIHNTQIISLMYLNANDTIQGALFGGVGSGTFYNYGELNMIKVIKL